MLNKEDAIRVEVIDYGITPSGFYGKQKIYIFKCINCSSEIRSQHNYLSQHSGKCRSCCQRKDPFVAPYNELVHRCRKANRDISLTYEEFVGFTKICECHYCGSGIVWHPHTKNKGKDILGSRSYKLDRKDNELGYSKDNCVVCCWECNQLKGNRFTYEEFIQISIFIKELRAKRAIHTIK